MLRLSTKTIFLLIFVIYTLGTASQAASNWPVKGKIDLSSGFGNLRENRFHAGVDIRTGGREGKQVFSPVKGYVYRISMSYKGYGKGLYIKGNDGYIYVFGHLSNFVRKIDTPVKKTQMATKRYYVDIYFPQDSIKIKKGELIGFSGQTGVGAPHLHFEKRTADNFPINPLKNGFELQDKVKPVFKKIIFKLTDDRSLFDTGTREMDFNVASEGKPGQYRLDTVLYFHRPFGVLTDVFDQMRPQGMKQAVYKISLYFDDKLYYQTVFDTIDFATQRVVNLEYDYLEAVKDNKYVRRLFHEKGDDFAGSHYYHSVNGIFGKKRKESIGIHEGKIIAEDAFGNSSVLTFTFMWGPENYIYKLDSISTAPPESTFFYFTPVKDYEKLSIDSVAVFLNRGERWGRVLNAKVTYFKNGQLKCKVIGQSVHSAVLRLMAFKNGALIRDNIFNGILKKGKTTTTLSYQIVDDGLLITLDVEARKGSESRIELYYKGSLLGTEYPQYFNMKKYICFIPPLKKYAHIDRIGYSMSKDTNYATKYVDSLRIYLVGLKDNQKINFDKNCYMVLNKNNFYEPRYIEVKKNRIITRNILGLNSDHYRIFPEAFVCRNDFDITLKLSSKNKLNPKSGICWLDEEKNRWVWLDNVYKDNVLQAKTYGGGSFAAVYDFEPPKMKILSIADRKTYYNLRPSIDVFISDTLSGIEDDRSIVIKLDGQWMIPEYDPEKKLCTTRPLKPLKPGKHHLGVEVTDRAGNIAEQYLNFYVAVKKNRRKH